MTAVLDTAVAYWLTQYQTTPEPCALPVDRTRQASGSLASARIQRSLSPAQNRLVHELGTVAGTNACITVLGGFVTLLARLTGQDDLVVGIPSRGDGAGILPLRFAPRGELPFPAFLRRVRNATDGAFTHQIDGHDSLPDRLARGVETGGIPLATVLFDFEVAGSRAEPLGGNHTIDPARALRDAPHVELLLRCVQSDDGLTLDCWYRADLLDESTVRRWLASLDVLLESAAALPDAPIARLNICTGQDRAILAQCNATASDVAPGVLVHRLFERQAERTPANTAIEQDGRQVSYGELNTRANQLAAHLRALGVSRGAFVGLSLQRTADLVVAVLAVLKTGACYVPLDPSLPTARLAAMATDAQLAALITENAVLRELSIPAPLTVSVDASATDIAARPAHNLPIDALTEPSATDPAYVLFTSGSTGTPKGVLVHHGGLVNLLLSVQKTPGLHPSDVVLAITTLSFDIAVSELLLPLIVGARIVLATREVASDGLLLRDVIESSGVTFIDATPATYRMLLAAGWEGGAHLRVICTGEALPRDLASVLVRHVGELWNGYGPTETTVWSTFHRVQEPVDRILIGGPVANTVVKIVDRNGEPVPVGVSGELFIGGAGVASGYLKRPDLTAERFTADDHEPSLRWYRTGDLVRLLPSAELECLGRADDQVKIRGYRIEPGEVAAVVNTWTGVQQSVVVARESAAGDSRLVAYVVADESTGFDDAFRTHLKRTLPEFMLPSAVVRLTALPLTPSGKIDKRALPAPDLPDAHSSREYVAPATPTETLLAKVWTQTLALERISTRDDFFALGGHSLLAAQILARLRRDHGIELTFRRLFEAPTIEALARLIDASSAGDARPPVPVVHRPHTATAQLSAVQERLWLLRELDSSREPAHNHSASWVLSGPLDQAALVQALDALVERHPILRTSFHVEQGERVQRVADAVTFAVESLDVSILETDAQKAVIDARFDAQQSLPFDISVAPLMRATLVRTAVDSHILHTTQHGLVWDGWSFDIFLRDLAALYESALTQQPPSLPTLPVTYGDFAEWQRAWLGAERGEEQRQWWDARLSSGPQALALPHDTPHQKKQTFAGDDVITVFDRDELDQLQTLAREQDATLFMVMFAAYISLLHLYSNQSDILVATPMRARTQPELEDLIGPFVNTVVIRTAIETGASFSDVLELVREQSLDSFTYQELPFEALAARLPEIRALFSMQDTRSRPNRMGQLDIRYQHVPGRFATNDLTMWITQYTDQLFTVLNFSTENMDRSVAAEFLSHYRALVGAVLATPHARVDSLLVAKGYDATSERALPAVGAPAASVLENIASVVATQARSVAVSMGAAAIDYETLWNRAGCVAAGLAHRTVAGTTVAVDLPNGVERAVAILGIMRAGGRVLALQNNNSSALKSALMTTAGAPCCIVQRDAGNRINLDWATVAQLEAAGAESAVPSAHLWRGLSVAQRDANGTMHIATLPADRVNAQVESLRSVLDLNAAAVVMSALPSGMPASVPVLLAAWSSGARVVLVGDGVATDAAELSEDWTRGRCTALIGTSDAWTSTLSDRWTAARAIDGLVVGEGLESDERHAITQRNASVFASFGNACDALLTSFRRIAADGPENVAGIPVRNTALRVANSGGESLIPGMPGALYMGRGGIDTEWVRTGYRARAASNGDVQIIADNSDTLLVAGERVNPAWIESAIRSIEGATDVAVTQSADRTGTRHVVAHIVDETRGGFVQTTLRSRLRSDFPDAWLPARVVTVAEVPRSADGSINRSALASAFELAASGHDAQLSDEELLVANVWKQVVGCPTIRRRDNFFHVGGTSLLAFRAIEMIRAQTGVQLSPRVLFIGSLAEAAAELERHRVTSP